MADATLNKLIHIAGEGATKELRYAALKMLAAVGTRDAKLVKTLLAVLDDPDKDLRAASIETLGALGADEALKRLEEFVRAGGTELESAVRAASQFGARGAKAMGKIMDDVSPTIRARVAGVLAKSNTSNALLVTAQGLLDADPRIVDGTARSLAMEIPGFSGPQRTALAKCLIEALGDKKISAKSEAGMLRVLTGLHEAKAEDIYWSRILPPKSAEVRAAALHGLCNAVPTTDKRLQALLTCASEREFQIVASALMILKKLPINAKTSKHWVQLLEAPDVATRRLAVERLQGVESAEVARAMVVQLRHPDRNLRDEALKALRAYPAGRDALLDEMLTSGDADRAWSLARAIGEVEKELTAAQRAKVFAEACKLHDKDDKRAAALLFFLREADHAWLRDQLEAHGLELRKKKKYAEAVGYYRILAQDPACSEKTRFELAATGLKLSTHDLELDNRSNDPALHQFTRLLQNASFDLIGHITKAKWIDVEGLFYVGFHFAEQTHRAQEFGKQVLETVVERSPKTEVGKQAKRKLKSAGLV